MLRRSETVYPKTFYLTPYLPIYDTQQIITFSLSPHLSFSPNLRLISSTIHSRLSLSLHSRFSGSLKMALNSIHITIIVTVSLISPRFICITAYYCSVVSMKKPPSSFHSCLIGFHRYSKYPHSSSLILSHLLIMYIIFVTLISFCEEIVFVIVLKFVYKESDLTSS